MYLCVWNDSTRGSGVISSLIVNLGTNRREKSPSYPARVTAPSVGPQVAGHLARTHKSFATVGNRRFFGSAARDYVD
jgi:hypothetical protein